ncbi:ABC transporter permease subunit [Kribbella sp. NBC_01505]|uniref:ABC transporter permease subunit n=1 Tax=Kribbella sp. NBC_01505 TaxID=2903580 RepID=UPI0038687DA8
MTGRKVAGGIFLALIGLYFLLPLVAAVEFSLRGTGDTHTLEVWKTLFQQEGFVTNLLTSLKLALGTVALTLLIMVPTTTLIHLRMPRFRRTMEAICVLPLAIPAVVLANGVFVAFQDAPPWLNGTPVILCFEYVVLSLPFTFRALDAGLSAIPVVALVEASRTLGGGWATALLRVVVPNLRTAILNVAILAAALALGEFTLASLLLLDTLPVWTVSAGQSNGAVATAASMLILIVSWVLLLVMSVLSRRRARTLRRSR